MTDGQNLPSAREADGVQVNTAQPAGGQNANPGPRDEQLHPSTHGEKTIGDRVVGQDSAPSAGLEREDAQPDSGELVRPESSQIPANPLAVGTRQGMWSTGTPDTSGYGGMQRDIVMPGLVEPPYEGWVGGVHHRLGELVPGLQITAVTVSHGEVTFYVPRENLPEVVRALRDDDALRFEVCVSVSGVHYPKDAGAELHSVYHLLSITHNRRLRLEVTCPDSDPHIPSVVATYPMADYHERETWDMFGIQFDGHPGLTRILMPDDWVGHPQRKDYPLGGIPIEYKGAVVAPPDQRRKYNA